MRGDLGEHKTSAPPLWMLDRILIDRVQHGPVYEISNHLPEIAMIPTFPSTKTAT